MGQTHDLDDGGGRAGPGVVVADEAELVLFAGDEGAGGDHEVEALGALAVRGEACHFGRARGHGGQVHEGKAVRHVRLPVHARAGGVLHQR